MLFKQHQQTNAEHILIPNVLPLWLMLRNPDSAYWYPGAKAPGNQ